MAVDLSKIVTGQVLKPPKVVVYGVGGIGKTTFAAGAPRPIFIFTEEGQGQLDVPRFELRPGDPLVRSWEEAVDCLKALHEGDHLYDTVVLDTLDALEPLLWSYTARQGRQPHIEKFGYGKGYTYALDHAQVLLDWLDALRRDRKMGVVLLCHCEVKRYEAPDTEPYDRYRLRLNEKLADRVRNWSDALMFANYRTSVVKDEVRGGDERARGVGRGERVLYTEERPAFWAKNRYGLPSEMSLQWQSFEAGIVRPTTTTTPPATPAGDQPKKKAS